MSEQQQYEFKVSVESEFIEGQSLPERGRYVFSYTITIENTGQVAAKLLSRHWVIIDGNGKQQEVHGDGVVGEQPYLRPGEGFRYTSGTMIDTPVGNMYGSYQIVADDGVKFEAEIPMFTLSMPHVLH